MQVTDLDKLAEAMGRSASVRARSVTASAHLQEVAGVGCYLRI
jgi:hypothetical protein